MFAQEYRVFRISLGFKAGAYSTFSHFISGKYTDFTSTKQTSNLVFTFFLIGRWPTFLAIRVGAYFEVGARSNKYGFAPRFAKFTRRRLRRTTGFWLSGGLLLTKYFALISTDVLGTSPLRVDGLWALKTRCACAAQNAMPPAQAKWYAHHFWLLMRISLWVLLAHLLSWRERYRDHPGVRTSHCTSIGLITAITHNVRTFKMEPKSIVELHTF